VNRARSAVLALCPRILRPYWNRLEASPLGYRLARGAFWSLIGTGVSRGLALAAAIVAARILGKSSFGELGMVRATVGMLCAFAGFGLGVTATKHVAQYRRSDPARAGRIMALSGTFAVLLGAIVAGLLALTAGWVATRTLAAPQLAGDLRVGALLLFVMTVTGVQTGALSGFEAFKSIAKVNLIAGIVTFLSVVVGVWYAGVRGALCGLVAAGVVTVLLNHGMLRNESRRFGVPLAVKGSLQDWQVLWRFSLPTFFGGAVVQTAYWVSQAVLVNRAGGYGAMGGFAAAIQWRTLFAFLAGLVCAGYLAISASLGPGEQVRRRKLLFVSVALAGGVTMATVLVAAFFGGPILAAYGPTFRSAESVFHLVLVLAVIDSVNMVLFQSLIATGRVWWRFFANGAYSALLVGFALVLVPDHGAVGLAMALLLAQGIHLAIQIPLALKALSTS